jgi:DNA polymerase III delta prime subunit
VVFLDTREPWPDLGRPAVPVEVPRPTAGEQQAAWAEALPPLPADPAPVLAGQFNLSLAAIREIARTVSAEPGQDSPALLRQLWDACLLRTRPRLGALAQRLEARAGWDDLVLPAAELGTLREIAGQVRRRGTVYEAWGFGRKTSRGLGVAALFAGESGTGKTLAAEVLAAELRLDLYRIDLSAVVSKYIGETEKNLRRLFDAAEDGGAILFFDEADALFGKRSEVRDSHDRYANIEINYLLQRMEAFRGLAVLATNLRGALDAAFLRRLRFVVTFPFPRAAERREIWRRAFPPEAPTEGLDPERLARLTLTGGSIRNIALHAAFLAAEAGTPVTVPLVLQAARAELRKLEQPINEADFDLQTYPGALA